MIGGFKRFKPSTSYFSVILRNIQTIFNGRNFPLQSVRKRMKKDNKIKKKGGMGKGKDEVVSVVKKIGGI